MIIHLLGVTGIRRQIRLQEIFLSIGLCLILLFMLVHDWVPLGKLNDVQAAADLAVSMN